MEQPTVLLLEDEPIIAADIQWCLKALNCRVLYAEQPSEVPTCCAQQTPVLAILNFHREAFADGMAQLRALRAVHPIKIFLLTGARWQDIKDTPDFNGACCEVLFKPFTRAQLQAALRKHLP